MKAGKVGSEDGLLLYANGSFIGSLTGTSEGIYLASPNGQAMVGVESDDIVIGYSTGQERISFDSAMNMLINGSKAFSGTKTIGGVNLVFDNGRLLDT